MLYNKKFKYIWVKYISYTEITNKSKIIQYIHSMNISILFTCVAINLSYIN